MTVPQSGRRLCGRVVAALTLVVTAMNASADQVSVPPSRDCTLYELNIGLLANGSGNHVFAGRNNQSPGTSIRRAILAFDIAANVPAGATINSVTLTMNMSRSTAGPTNVSAHRLSTDWNEGPAAPGGQEGSGTQASAGDTTWIHTYYDTQLWTTAGGDFIAGASATTNVGGLGSYSWTGAGLVADMQFWLDNPALDFGWIMLGDESSLHTAKRFDSRENPTPADRPELVIDFTAPVAVGACCLPGNSCQVLTEVDCINMTGTYQGSGTDCTGNSCAPVTGACCFDDTTCQDLASTACAFSGGTYQGDLVACTVGLCPLVLEPFVDAMPVPAVMVPDSFPGGVPHYDMEIVEFEQKLHRDLPDTRLWGYEGVYPGPTIEAVSGQPIEVNFINDLRDELNVLRTEHLLPVDLCPHGPNFLGNSPRVVTHLHGGHIPAEFDGNPEDTILPGESQLYEYPNIQDASTLWYHDHALGITRLNVYLGLAGFYLIDDGNDAALNLPDGAYDVPIVMQDRSFNVDGSLEYPAAWQDHYFGDFMVVNGVVTPFMDVDQGKYRLRLLNGCNARTLTLSLSNSGSFDLIAVDGGLLETPTTMTVLTLAPAERVEVIVDFALYTPGTEIILENSAPAPFPGTPGVGVIPNVMKFIVGASAGDTDAVPGSLRVIETLNEVDSKISRNFELKKVSEPCAGSQWLINGHHWDHISEFVNLGDTEIWEFTNMSGMMHPMHMHLVFFQVLDRQPNAVRGDDVNRTGVATGPTATEVGWKDTVQVGPFETVRVIARFEDYTGLFPYHCHILEHEDHEMMRQYEVRVPCPADFTDASSGPPDDVVDVFDLLALLSAWGPCGDPNNCPADITNSATTGPDGVVDVFDLLELLSSWGGCV